ncbi:hypothetical protein GCM10009560_25360 [Nonomuraea longicatena]|uniref:Uncharacterized protein n=2 Tax=Nonomuraea longicatena TaxID=83682 RepID=A0ABN1P8W8_9ACTN
MARMDKNWRQTLADYVLLGWTPCGFGDWAVAVRSPDGLRAARICPFDPAYAAFLELCRRLPGNPYLPEIALTAELSGGGSLVVMEYLAPAASDEAAELKRRWSDGGGDPQLAAVRAAADAVDADFRASTPWWDGFDLNPGNVGRALDGRPVLLDVFCMDGASLYAQILADASVVKASFPKARDVLDIPFIARQSRPEEIADLRAAWTVTPA